jgi:hypothetical protein
MYQTLASLARGGSENSSFKSVAYHDVPTLRFKNVSSRIDATDRQNTYGVAPMKKDEYLRVKHGRTEGE